MKNIASNTGMLIRRPIEKVYEAFINPDITTKFWFTKSSGKLKVGDKITWTWEMYNYSSDIIVKEIDENKKICIDWLYGDVYTQVEWRFFEYLSGTFVEINHSGFSGDYEKIVAQALDSTGGFTLVLSGAKAFLEYNIMLNLTADRFPLRSN